MEFLSSLHDLCMRTPDLRSVTEHFRGGPLEALAREIELGSLRCDELNEEALKTEFEQTWSKFQLLAKSAELRALTEKSRRAQLTDEEKLRFKELVQIRLETAATE